MAPYEDLYGRKCRLPIGWFDVGETTLVGPKLVHQAIEKIKLIQERLLAAQSCIADERRYEVRKKGKNLALGTLDHIGSYARDPSRVVSVDDVQVTEQLSYEETPIAILDRQVRRLRTKDVASVKVLWRNNNVEEMT
ncbi:uncharacterized protein [Nicotiana tomentosiformis]|uniref:uncharacterized protein n=1 Tax=Nicotiana tomentosiformis TaxID=4098 RepID=UPI00388CD4A3